MSSGKGASGMSSTAASGTPTSTGGRAGLGGNSSSGGGGSGGSAFFQAAREKEAAGSALAYYRTNLDVLARKYEDLDAVVQKERERSRALESELGQYKTLFHSLSDKVAVSQSVISAVPKLRSDVQNLSAMGSPIADRSALATRQMAEDVFQRVHQEFSSVVADVVKTCIREQNSRIKESVNLHLQKIEQKYKERTEEDRAVILDVLGRCETLETRFNSLEQTFHQQAAALERLQNSAVKAYRREMQTAMESMSKQVTESVENNAAALKKVTAVEKTFQSHLHRAMESLVTRVEARSAGLEGSLKSAVTKIQSLDEDILDVRRRMFSTETMARHALNTASIAGTTAASSVNQHGSPISSSGKDRGAVSLNASHVSIAALEATVLRSQQEQLGEAISCIEREHADLISRFNMLTGDVDSMKEEHMVFKGIANENNDRMKNKFREYEAAFQSLKHTRDALDVLTKRCEAILVQSSKKATKDVAELKEESMRHAVDIADLKEGLDRVTRSYLSKKMMVEVLHSESPIPSVLLDRELSPTQTPTPKSPPRAATSTPLRSPWEEAKDLSNKSKGKQQHAPSPLSSPREPAAPKDSPLSRAVPSWKEVEEEKDYSEEEEVQEHKVSSRETRGVRGGDVKRHTSPSPHRSSPAASAAASSYGKLSGVSEHDEVHASAKEEEEEEDDQRAETFEFDEDFVVTAVAKIVRTSTRGSAADEFNDDGVAAGGSVGELTDADVSRSYSGAAEGEINRSSSNGGVGGGASSRTATAQSVDEKRRQHRQRFQQEIRNG